MKSKILFLGIALSLFSIDLQAFRGTISYSVQYRTMDEPITEDGTFIVDYLIDEHRATFTRVTPLGESQCIYYRDSLELILELFGELRSVSVRPDEFDYFQDGQPLSRYVENGETRLFKGVTCIGYDLIFEGEQDMIGKAFCMPTIPNFSLDLPSLPSMPIEFELVQGFELITYKALSLRKDKIPSYLFESGSDLPHVNFSGLEEEFSQAVFTIPSLQKDYDMNLLVEGFLVNALAEEREVLKGMDVKIYSGDKVVAKTKSDDLGHYSLLIPLGKVYRIEYGSKSVVRKSLVYDTQNIPYLHQVGGFLSNVDVALFRPKSGVDYTLAKDPIGKASYVHELRIIDFDMQYTASQLDKISAAIGDEWK